MIIPFGSLLVGLYLICQIRFLSSQILENCLYKGMNFWKVVYGGDVIILETDFYFSLSIKSPHTTFIHSTPKCECRAFLMTAIKREEA